MLITHCHSCLGCGGCVPLCPTEALLLLRSGIACEQDRCIVCGDCVSFCPVAALELDFA